MLDLSLLNPVVLVLLVSGLVIMCRYHRKRARMVSLINRIPGPPSLPFIGNAIELNVDHDELLARMMAVTKLCGRRAGMCRIWIGNKPYIIVARPDRIEPILSSSKHIGKSGDYSYLHPWLGTGLLTSAGEKWRSRRKIITPAFHFKILEDFIDVFLDQSLILVKKLKREIGNESGFNIFPYVTLCTLDIICETAMGRQMKTQENSESEYVKAVYEMGSIIQNRQSKLWLQPDWLFRWTSMYKSHEKCIKILHGVSNKVIQERTEELKKRAEQKEKFPTVPEDQDMNAFGNK